MTTNPNNGPAMESHSEARSLNSDLRDAPKARPSYWKLAIEICTLAGVVMVVAWFALFLNSLPKADGPHGELIPTSKPDERNRAVHLRGFSLIAPENWDRLPYGETGEPAYLQIAARGTPGRRLKSMITVTYLGESFDETVAKKLEQSIFQGQVAWETCRITKPYTFDDGARSECDLYFKREQNWWHIHFLIADEIASLPISIRQFLETFRAQTGEEAANNPLHRSGDQPPALLETLFDATR